MMIKQQVLEVEIASQMTGCDNAGMYRGWAAEHGFSHLAVVDWTSSAGDWSFIVSRDGFEWFPMFQENRWPRAGFDRSVDESTVFYGSEDEALNEVCEYCQ
jgi:hypothetical protein